VLSEIKPRNRPRRLFLHRRDGAHNRLCGTGQQHSFRRGLAHDRGPPKSPEEIIAKLRQAEVLFGEGKKVPEVVKALGVHEVTYYRWRSECGGLKVSQAKRLKDLESENARLRRAVSDLTPDKLILQEAARGNF
jgi:transposase-like protein